MGCSHQVRSLKCWSTPPTSPMSILRHLSAPWAGGGGWGVGQQGGELRQGLQCNDRSDNLKTLKADGKLEMFREPEGEADDGHWEHGVVFIKLDQIKHPGYVLVDDGHSGFRGWVPIEHVRPFSEPKGKLTQLTGRGSIELGSRQSRGLASPKQACSSPAYSKDQRIQGMYVHPDLLDRASRARASDSTSTWQHRSCHLSRTRRRGRYARSYTADNSLRLCCYSSTVWGSAQGTSWA